MKGHTTSKALAASSRRFAGPSSPRYNSSSASISQSTDAPPSSSTSWSPALPKGQHKAYDTALSYLQSHRDNLVPKIEKLKSLSNPTPAQLRRIDTLEVDAYTNDPATRFTWSQTRGEGLMARPVFRHIAERKWKKQGGLDLVMGRVYQNKVVPDLIPDLAPTLPLTLRIADGAIEPAIRLPPSAFETPPKITFQAFQHPSQPSSVDDAPKGLYTLITIDPDVPDVDTHAFTERVMSLKTDIPISVLDGELDLLTSSSGNEIFNWEPPAPPNGSNTHRYITFLLRQTPTSTSPSISQRDDFSLRQYLRDANLDETAVHGITLFRSEWSKEEDQYINKIWREVRSREEGAPVYGKGPKADRYGYPLNSVQRRAAEIRRGAWERAVEERGGMHALDGVDAIEAMENGDLMDEEGKVEVDQGSNRAEGDNLIV